MGIRISSIYRSVPPQVEPASLQIDHLAENIGNLKRENSKRSNQGEPASILEKRFSVYTTVIDGTGKLDVGEYELQLFDSRYMIKEEQPKRFSGWLKPSCIPITIILVLIFLVVLLPLLETRQDDLEDGLVVHEYHKKFKNCSSPCVFTLVETLPDGEQRRSMSSVWLDLISLARSNIHIATSDFQTFEDDQREEDYDQFESKLKNLTSRRGFRFRMVLNDKNQSQNFEELFNNASDAQVRYLNLERLTGMESQLRVSIFVVDQRHFYLGSAPLRWDQATQTKEMGIMVYNCSCLAHDLTRIVEVYWILSEANRTKIPTRWPFRTHTPINRSDPVSVELNQTSTEAYITSSPSVISSRGRSNHVEGILKLIEGANEFVYISTNDYFPIAQSNKNSTNVYWPTIDDALRSAAVNKKIDMKLLTAQINDGEDPFLRMDFLNSLVALNISVKIFRDKDGVTKSFTSEPNQFIVTEDKVYIGTSSWSGNSLLHDGSVGIFIDQSPSSRNNNSTNASLNSPVAASVPSHFRDTFLRDWNSKYAGQIRLTSIIER